MTKLSKDKASKLEKLLIKLVKAFRDDVKFPPYSWESIRIERTSEQILKLFAENNQPQGEDHFTDATKKADSIPSEEVPPSDQGGEEPGNYDSSGTNDDYLYGEEGAKPARYEPDEECKHEAFGISNNTRYCWTCKKYLGEMPKLPSPVSKEQPKPIEQLGYLWEGEGAKKMFRFDLPTETLRNKINEVIKRVNELSREVKEKEE